MSFKKLATPVTDSNGEEYTHKCVECDAKRGQEYFGCWIDEDSGEFTDDRWVIECFSCGHTAKA